MRILGALLLLAVLGVAGYLWLNSPPQLRPAAELKTVGRQTPVTVVVNDRSGVRRFRAWWEQDGKTVPIDERDLGGAKQQEVQFVAGPGKQQGLKDGPARLWVEATDAGWLLPKRQQVSWDTTIRSQPPRLSVVTGQHYVNQGGCDMVVYTVSEGAVSHGVRVGTRFFPGYAMPGGAAGTYFAVFAFPYNEPATTVPRVVARDDAGNEAVAGFWFKLFPKQFRKRDIQLSDQFLQQVVPAILSRTNEVQDQGDLLKNFLAINGTLRQKNAAQIVQFSQQSEQKFLWSEPFSQLTNSQVEAQFADHRAYFYNGKEVDRQDHLGFDLATTQHAPVEAANRGKIIFADYLGIYGNTVVIDHGYGLQSLYAHLNDFAVKVGDIVEKRQTIGHSDSTGLAAGDHLHYSMMLAGEQVNATEWWDSHWLQDRVFSKFPGGKLPQ